MKKRHLFHVIVMVTLGSLLSPVSVRAEDSKRYLTLVHDKAKIAYGHIIVRIPPDRQAPKGWRMRWYVSTYTPKGHKLSLGFIRDWEPLDDDGRLIFDVPVGEQKIEITRRSEQWAEGGTKEFIISEGLWEYRWPKTIKMDDVIVPIKKGDIEIVNISYQNARVSEGYEKRRKKVTLYTCERFKLLVEEGSPTDLPEKEPALYPIINYAEFKKIDETHLIEALKKDEGYAAAIALLNCEKPNARLITRALADKSLELNVSVARILARAGDNSAVMPLISLLEQGSERQRYTAAWTLGELKAKEAAEALIAALEDKSILLRNHAAYALAQIKDQRAVDALIEALKDRGQLPGSLFVLSDPEMYIAYCFTREDGILGPHFPTPSNEMRGNAIYALGQIGGEKATNALLNFIDDPDAGIQVQAIFALINHKDSTVIDALIKKLKSDRQASRWMAVKVLGKMRAKKALDSLADLAQNDADERVRETAREALEKIEKADW